MAMPTPDEYQVSCAKWTIMVCVYKGMIVDIAPLMHIWVGQDWQRFLAWSKRRFGPLQVYHLWDYRPKRKRSTTV